MDGINAWHAFVRSRDAASLNELLDQDVTFDSPVVHATQHGRAITASISERP